MIKLSNINFSYGNHEILRDVNFEISEGEFCAILGPNGAGKSTIMKLIGATLIQNSGEIFFNSQNLKNLPAQTLAKHRAFLEQENYLSFNYSVKEILNLGLFPRNDSFTEKKSAYENAIALCDLNGFEHRSFFNLSGGEKKRVLLARAIAQIYSEDMQGKLLLLDEPSASLDPYHSCLILNSAKTLSKLGCTVIAILHDPNLAVSYADTVIAIKDKKVFPKIDAQNFITKENISQLYGASCNIIDYNNKAYVFFG